MSYFNEYISYQDPADQSQIQYLFSFQGNTTARVRERLFAAEFGGAPVLVERTQPGAKSVRDFWDKIGSPEVAEFKRRYAEVMRRSKFVLCPRGVGTSSYRLYETLESGFIPGGRVNSATSSTP